MFKTNVKLNYLILHFPCWFLVFLVFLVHYKLRPVNTGLQWKNRFLQQPIKGVFKLVPVKINNCGTLTRVDSDILNKKDVLCPPKKYILIEKKSLFNVIYFLLVISNLSNYMCKTACRFPKSVETGDSCVIVLTMLWFV